MESLDRFRATVALGKRLVAQLNLGDDLLTHWMAHDVAARMKAVESADTPEALRSARDDCARSILALWERRNELPPHLRPFKELEPLVRTLVSLDVNNGDRSRYFPSVLSKAALNGVDDSEAKNWLELALSLDYSARLLIQFALRAAGAAAASKAAPWIEAALRAGADAVMEEHAVVFVSPASPTDAQAKAAEQSLVRQKIEKLDAFANLAVRLAAQLRTQLNSDEVLEPEETRDVKRPRAKGKRRRSAAS